MAQQSFTEQVHPPWQQQAQTTALEIEQVQRQLEAVQAQDPKSFLSVDPMTVTTGHQQISAQDLMQQTAAFLQQMPTLNGLGIATSGTLSPQLAGTPVFCNGASPSLSTSSFGGQPSPNVHQGGGFFPFSGMDLVSPQPSQQGFMPMSPGFGTDTLQAHDNSPVNRTVYVGNLPAQASVDELLSQVRFGPIESVKILPEKSCAFISFLDPAVASAFHSDLVLRKINLHDQELKVGWGKPSTVPPVILNAVQQHGASRNVYLGGLPPDMTEEKLRDDLARYGFIDQVKLVRDKSIGFVHFLSIATALRVVTTLPQEPEWQGRRVNFGKDRCAYVPKNQQQQQQHNMQAAAMAATYTNNWGQMSAAVNSNNAMNMPAGQRSPAENTLLAQCGNRTIYLGHLHPDTSVEEICNTVRGGILQNIRFMPEKHICFITFVDPNAALAFFTTALQQGLTIHARRLRVGWGRNQPLSPGVQMVVQAGGSRNVYVGGIDNSFDEAKLRQDFSEFGDIELVNILREKSCGFINFHSIGDAIKSIEGIRKKPEYANLKISYGKDRCGNISRAFSPRVLSPQTSHSNGSVMPSPMMSQSAGFNSGSHLAYPEEHSPMQSA